MYKDPWQEWEGRVEGSLDEFPGLISRERRKRKTLAWTRFGGRERDRYGGKERISVSGGGGREGEGHLERRSTVRIVSTRTGGSPTPPRL